MAYKKVQKYKGGMGALAHRKAMYKKARSMKGYGQLNRIAGMAKTAWRGKNKKLSQQLWKIHGERAAFLMGAKGNKFRKRAASKSYGTRKARKVRRNNKRNRSYS